MNIGKIKQFLEDRHKKICEDFLKRFGPSTPAPGFETVAWTEYLNAIDCEILSEEEVVEEFENLFNYSSKTKICVSMDVDFLAPKFILVPKELANKALVLGGLPDSWFPEKSESFPEKSES